MTSPFLQRAETSLKSAKVLLGIGDTDGACRRAYYAMYDPVRDCLGWAGIAPERGEFAPRHHRRLRFASGEAGAVPRCGEQSLSARAIHPANRRLCGVARAA